MDNQMSNIIIMISTMCYHGFLPKLMKLNSEPRFGLYRNCAENSNKLYFVIIGLFNLISDSIEPIDDTIICWVSIPFSGIDTFQYRIQVPILFYT